MMAAPMTLARARAIAQEVTAGRSKFGAQFKPAQSQSELLEAIAVLNIGGNFDGPTQEEITKANRRAGAAESRLKRCLGKETPLQGGEQGGDLG